jgi:hypothetical protein
MLGRLLIKMDRKRSNFCDGIQTLPLNEGSNRHVAPTILCTVWPRSSWTASKIYPARKYPRVILTLNSCLIIEHF